MTNRATQAMAAIRTAAAMGHQAGTRNDQQAMHDRINEIAYYLDIIKHEIAKLTPEAQPASL